MNYAKGFLAVCMEFALPASAIALRITLECFVGLPCLTLALPNVLETVATASPPLDHSLARANRDLLVNDVRLHRVAESWDSAVVTDNVSKTRHVDVISDGLGFSVIAPRLHWTRVQRHLSAKVMVPACSSRRRSFANARKDLRDPTAALSNTRAPVIAVDTVYATVILANATLALRDQTAVRRSLHVTDAFMGHARRASMIAIRIARVRVASLDLTVRITTTPPTIARTPVFAVATASVRLMVLDVCATTDSEATLATPSSRLAVLTHVAATESAIPLRTRASARLGGLGRTV